ncbi:MerR family transcriptional regulator [Breznakiella homolactica]|uniref:MerR family transcriptional regulator n=1 Tax=Breznakiella homolactica TaxID=2798577 RepID=A0A7T7XM97_9SPIR|nr:MerR family transcriptional regulator [Breznakiella homolactica]QQO08848.1 MerR family transcriptional regulator [Breznakiella homolactica]
MEYSIGEFSEITTIGIYTLRYYEKEGLLKPERNGSGRRVYDERDIAWIEFIKRLKDTGMPITEIREYAVLREKGDKTLRQRYALLTKHKIYLGKKIKELNRHYRKLDDKIRYYENEIKKRK